MTNFSDTGNGKKIIKEFLSMKNVTYNKGWFINVMDSIFEAGQKAKDEKVDLCYAENCEGKPAYCLFHFKKEGFDREEQARASERQKCEEECYIGTCDNCEIEAGFYFCTKCMDKWKQDIQNDAVSKTLDEVEKIIDMCFINFHLETWDKLGIKINEEPYDFAFRLIKEKISALRPDKKGDENHG